MTSKKQSLLREASHQIIAGGSAGKTPFNFLFHTIRNFVYQLAQSRARLVHIQHQLADTPNRHEVRVKDFSVGIL